MPLNEGTREAIQCASRARLGGESERQLIPAERRMGSFRVQQGGMEP